MANEIQINLGETGLTVYAVVRNAAGQAWNGSAFATYTTTRSTWDLALAEIGTTGHYGPISVVGSGAGRWWEIYLQAGGSPSHTDDILLAVGYESTERIAETLFKYDLSTITSEAARSLLNAVRFLRNKWSISGGTLTVCKEDDSTAAWTATLSTAAANPVTGADPS